MPVVIRQGRVIATCEICGRMAHWGFGPMWACSAHFEVVEAQWIAAGSPAK
jgi:hypothetical protein